MRRTNKVSGEFPQSAKDAALEKIDSAKADMPFLISLPEAERKSYGNMGPKSVAYAKQCLEGAKAFPEELKANFDLAEFERDFNVVNNLLGVRVVVASLLEQIDDTMQAAGIDIMNYSSEVYASLKVSAKGNASVKEMVSLISARFKEQGRKTPKV